MTLTPEIEKELRSNPDTHVQLLIVEIDALRVALQTVLESRIRFNGNAKDYFRAKDELEKEKKV